MATLDPGPGSPRPLDQTTPTVTPPPAAESTSLMMMDIPPAVVLTDDLIAEILSYLSVKNLMQLRTVCKAWKTLISNPTFVNLHLHRSPQNPYLTLKWFNHDKYFTVLSKVLSVFPVRSILENLPVNLDDEAFCNGVELIRCEYSSYPSLEGEYNRIVGSCNGLLCFYSRKVTVDSDDSDGYSKYWLHFQNLAMRTKSEKLGQFLDSYTNYCFAFKFSFGYDNSTRTYKVVAYRVDDQDYDSWTSEVKIFNLGDNSWRTIQSFPVPPLTCYVPRFGHSEPKDGVHLFGTINWLALTNTSGASLHGWTHINAESLVILSLSLSTETYTQLLLPKGLNVDLHVQPTLRVLGNCCLCFSHDFRGTEFVIWQLREFGVRESWTQLIKVSYQTLGTENLPVDDRMYSIRLLPLYLSKDSDTLIFANFGRDNPAFIYYRKDNRVERIRYSKDVLWFSTMDYVESLVPAP